MVYSNETERHPLFPDEALKALSDGVRRKAGKGFTEMDEPALKKLIDEMSSVDIQDSAMDIRGEVLPPSVTIPHLIVTGERGGRFISNAWMEILTEYARERTKDVLSKNLKDFENLKAPLRGAVDDFIAKLEKTIEDCKERVLDELLHRQLDERRRKK